jgi:outer membrane protein
LIGLPRVLNPGVIALKDVRVSCLVLFGLLVASFPVTGADIKIGFVNAAKILDQAPQAALARNRLKEEFAHRDQELLEAQRILRELEERLATEGAELDDMERRRLDRDILMQKRDINRARDEIQEDFNIRRNEELEKLQRQVYEAIVALAKEEKFDLIVNDGAVIYAGERVDITDKVLQFLK